MKTTIHICAALLSLMSFSMEASAAAPPISLSLKCRLVRMTWDQQNQKKVIQDLTPASVKEIPIEIATEESHEMHAADIPFKVSTPDGQMSFRATVFANDVFGTQTMLSSSLSVDVPSKDISITNFGSFPKPIVYNDPNTGLNPVDVPGVLFATGRKADGHMTAEYVGACDILVIKK